MGPELMDNFRINVFQRASICRNFDEMVSLQLQKKVINYPVYLSVGQEFISATIAQELVVLPLNSSPMIKSEVFPVGPVRADITTVGADGFPVSTDS